MSHTNATVEKMRRQKPRQYELEYQLSKKDDRSKSQKRKAENKRKFEREIF